MKKLDLEVIGQRASCVAQVSGGATRQLCDDVHALVARIREQQTEIDTLRIMTPWCLFCSGPPEPTDNPDTMERVDEDGCCPSCGADRTLAGVSSYLHED